VKGHEDVAHVAAISSQSEQIGSLIADAMDKVGKDGVITVEDNQAMATELEVVEGIQFDRGYTSAYMVTNPDRMEAVLEEPFVLISDRKISAISDLLPVLAKVVQQGKARRVTVNKDDTTIVEGAGKTEAIQGRIKALKAQIEETTSDYDKEKLQERMAKLAGGVAVIKVGAPTEVEQKEKKHRIE